MNEKYISELQSFFDRSVCKQATRPLRDRIEIAIFINEEGPITLTKQEGRMVVLSKKPHVPDLTFWIPEKALEELLKNSSESIGDLGVEIIKLMAHSDPNTKMRSKVHIGLFEFLRGGYLGVLPLGGAPVMKYLASHGLTSLGKIRDAIARLRT